MNATRWAMALLLAVAALPDVAAQSPPAGLPEQVHVTLAEDGGLVVQWAVVGAPYSQRELPFVQYSVDGAPAVYELAHLAGTLLHATAASSAAGAASAYHYSATIPVPLGAYISYSVGSDARGMAGPFTVRNVPPANEPLRFLAYGDIGVDTTAPDGGIQPAASTEPPGVRTDAHAHGIRDLALRQEAGLWAILGDLSYDNSGLGWSKFLRFAQPLQATVPTMPVAGNHEWDSENALGYAQFLNAYVLPGDEQNFVFRAGPVTFIGFNSDALCGPGEPAQGSPQEPCYGRPGKPDRLHWLEGALQGAAADAQPWTVVYFHHPVWSWGRHGSSTTLQALLSPLFEEYGVDAVITAHDHLYSRTYPLVGDQVRATGSSYPKGVGPVYVVVGGGGRALYDMPDEPAPAWHAAGEKVHHLSVWDANATTLEARVLREDGSLLDTFRIETADSALDPEVSEGETAGAFALLAPLALTLVAVLRRRGTA